MHDVNPLGLTMYLRELDRQAARRLRPLPAKQDTSSPISFGAAVAMLLQRLRLIANRWTVARNW